MGRGKWAGKMGILPQLNKFTIWKHCKDCGAKLRADIRNNSKRRFQDQTCHLFAIVKTFLQKLLSIFRRVLARFHHYIYVHEAQVFKMSHLYRGPFPNSTSTAPGLVPLIRPSFSAPMPLVAASNSNKIIADESTQSVAQPVFNKNVLESSPRSQEKSPTQESIIGPASILKVN